MKEIEEQIAQLIASFKREFLRQETQLVLANKWLPASYIVLDPLGRFESWLAWRPVFEREFLRMENVNHWN